MRAGSRLQVAMERVFEPFSMPSMSAPPAAHSATARAVAGRDDMYLVTRVRLLRLARDIAALDDAGRERRLADLAWWSEDEADKGSTGVAATAAASSADGKEMTLQQSTRQAAVIKPHLAARDHFQSVFSEDDVVRCSFAACDRLRCHSLFFFSSAADGSLAA